ncbi:cytochrome P450 [Rhodocollybia butyracea]|uniref:Cytochrome P450 n=1 Tax=Rhodocollybia butyracea TaxID=206335 RepID=A0A9P5U5N4_9AGAR|nr:cytochrome P450 [Rhodocollybia butyracea]
MVFGPIALALAIISASSTFILLVAVSLLAVLWHRNAQRYPAPLPPGPKPYPLIENILDLPRTRPWSAFKKWADAYGSIVHVSAFGQHFIVINDAQYATEMLDKKSRIYSGRPKLAMAGRLVGWEEGPALQQSGAKLSEYRRRLSQFMGTRSKIEAFHDILQQEADTYLENILNDSQNWLKYAHRYASGIVLMLVYGYKTSGNEDDAMVELVDEAMDQLSEVIAPNAFLVDTFPILQYVPSWVPGAAWKKKAHHYRRTLHDVLNIPYSWTKTQIAAGTARPSFVSSQLDTTKLLSSDDEHIIRMSAVSISAGGTDTTVSAIEAFFMAMIFHRSAQLKAQKEIDSVVGHDRLPTLEDREQLPYVEALIQETLRVYSLGPIGIPHALSENDIHHGYFIPKGSVIFTNNVMFYNDPKVYPEPEKFSPERFLASNGNSIQKDPREYLFGFGRRVCPGMHLGNASVWLACATVLAAFDVSPAVKNGVTVMPSGNFTDGIVSHPEPFECTITPRSTSVVALLQKS